MLEALALSGDERVPELGTGLGYQAAVLGRLAREVWSVERRPELAAAAAANLAAEGVENVHVSAGDGQGEGAGAPYDAIVVAHADEQSRVALGSVRARRPGRTPAPVQSDHAGRAVEGDRSCWIHTKAAERM